MSSLLQLYILWIFPPQTLVWPCSHFLLLTSQSTREVLNEYYTNLVRTHSSGRYILAGVSTSPIGSESDIDIDSGQSREPSPEAPTCRSAEPTAILIDLGSHVGAPRATLEQNIAFAALQQSQHQYHQNPSWPSPKEVSASSSLSLKQTLGKHFYYKQCWLHRHLLCTTTWTRVINMIWIFICIWLEHKES